MARRPYIGITDFETGDQVTEIGDYFATLPCADRYRMMAGVMISYKSFHGLPTSWTAFWPSKERLATIFVPHPLVFNTIHYADYDAITRLDDLLSVVEMCGEHLHAIQLDMVWPDEKMVRGLTKRFPTLDVVLQVSSRAIELEDNCAENVARRVAGYAASVDYVLLDCSMGTGKSMDALHLSEFAETIIRRAPGVSRAFAGGLGPNTLGLVRPLVERFAHVSIDAQSRLRPSGSAKDPIDWQMARDYLRAAVELQNLVWRELPEDQ